MEALTSIMRVFMSMQITDVIDILFIWILIYWILVYVIMTLKKKTRSTPLIIGLILIVLIFIAVSLLKLKVTGLLLANGFQVVLIAIVVIFQPELRRALEKVGAIVRIKNDQSELTDARTACIEGLAEACMRLSDTKTGAIIAIERNDSLQEQVDGGTVIDAFPEPRLFCNLFYNKAPMHDQAIVIRNFRIYAASCPLIPTTRLDVPEEYGARHRAAIGMSEKSDAVILLVSEETGHIGIFEGGEYSIYEDTTQLTRIQLENILQDKIPQVVIKNKKSSRRSRGRSSDADSNGGENE